MQFGKLYSYLTLGPSCTIFYAEVKVFEELSASLAAVSASLSDPIADGMNLVAAKNCRIKPIKPEWLIFYEIGLESIQKKNMPGCCLLVNPNIA